MKMSKRQIIVLVAVALIVVAAVVTGVFLRKSEPVGPGEKGTEGEVTMPGPGGEEIPVFNSETPDGAKLTPPTAAEAPAAPGTEERFGAFNMTASAAGFNPGQITVGKGDVVQIRITAEEDDFDFSLPYNGIYVMVPKGETKQITFGINTEGTYTFMCRDYCPAGKTISGSLIVLP